MDYNFELTLDVETGEPFIKFRHYDKSNMIHHKLLFRFIKLACEGGLILRHTGGHGEVGNNNNSWENYEIRITNKITESQNLTPNPKQIENELVGFLKDKKKEVQTGKDAGVIPAQSDSPKNK